MINKYIFKLQDKQWKILKISLYYDVKEKNEQFCIYK